jgi:hypothetical protein
MAASAKKREKTEAGTAYITIPIFFPFIYLFIYIFALIEIR